MEIKILKKVLAANDAIAQANRELFVRNGVFAINMMSSPGSGKTTIIERTVRTLQSTIRMGVVEGDIASTIDAERLSKLDIPVVQINTEPFGGDCHLEASWVKDAVSSLPLKKIDLLFIENVGNLVCPAEFATGADINLVVVSLPEGDDKPSKYPLMFRVSQVMMVNKIDLKSVVTTDTGILVESARKVNPELKILQVSASTGEGFDEWITWLSRSIKNK